MAVGVVAMGVSDVGFTAASGVSVGVDVVVWQQTRSNPTGTAYRLMWMFILRGTGAYDLRVTVVVTRGLHVYFASRRKEDV